MKLTDDENAGGKGKGRGRGKGIGGNGCQSCDVHLCLIITASIKLYNKFKLDCSRFSKGMPRD